MEFKEPRLRLSGLAARYNEYRMLYEIHDRLTDAVMNNSGDDNISDCYTRVSEQLEAAMDRLVIDYLLQQNASFGTQISKDLPDEQKQALTDEANRRYIEPIKYINEEEYKVLSGNK